MQLYYFFYKDTNLSSSLISQIKGGNPEQLERFLGSECKSEVNGGLSVLVAKPIAVYKPINGKSVGE